MKGWIHTYWKEVLLALVLACVYLGFHGSYGLFDVDEAIFTQATREMVDGGPYSMPTYNGEPRYQKPPLIYWIQAAFMGVLGEDSLWAARLPSAVFGLMTVALVGLGVFHFTRDRRWALVSAAAMGLNVSFLVVGRAATADAVLNFFMLALVLWCVEVVYGKKRPWGFWVTGVLVALGLLAKGPVAGIPAALVVGVLLAFREDRWQILWKFEPFKVLAVAAGCLLPWVGLLAHEGMLAGFFTQFVMDENLKRFGPGLTNTQGGNPMFYLGVLAVGFFPWVFMVPKAVGLVRRDWWVRVRSADVAVALPYLALVWACGIVGLFMLSGTKLAHYIVPAYPALAILVGYWLAKDGGRVGSLAELWALVQGAVMVVVLGVLPLVLVGLREDGLQGFVAVVQQLFGFAWPPRDVLTREVLRLAVDVPLWPFVGAVVGVFVAGMGVFVARARLGLMAGGMGVFLVCVVVGIVPVVWGYTQAPLAELAKDVAAVPAEVRVIHLGMHKPSVLYLSQRPFTKLEKPLQLVGDVKEGERVVIVTEQAEVAGIGLEMGRVARVEVLRCLGGYCLVGVARGARY